MLQTTCAVFGYQFYLLFTDCMMQRRAPPPVNHRQPEVLQTVNQRHSSKENISSTNRVGIQNVTAADKRNDLEGRKTVSTSHFNGQCRNTVPHRDIEVSTTDRNEKACQVSYPAIPKTVERKHRRPLLAFLRALEETVVEQLEVNLVSTAEKYYDAELEPETDTPEFIASADQNALITGHCTCLSWNSTGTLLAASFGEREHETFCDHKGGVLISKTNRITGKKEMSPYITCETDTCVSSTSFHPHRPNLLAAAGCNGQIFLWDVTASPGNLIGSSGMRSLGGHSEVITCLRWIPMDFKKRTFMILTGACDGRLITWINQASPKQTTSATTSIIPHKYTTIESASTLSGNERTTIAPGISSLSTLPEADEGYCVTGTDTGAVLLCNLKRFSDIKLPITASSVSLKFASHMGLVTAVAFSPFSTKCFATTSQDGKLRIFCTTMSRPLLEMTGQDLQLTCCAWSPFRPFVIAVGTTTGLVLFFDFMFEKGRFQPVKKVPVYENEQEISTLAFNHHECTLLAIGAQDGVHLWKMPDTLAKPSTDEIQQFQSYVHSKY